MKCCACLKATTESLSTRETCSNCTIAEILQTHLNWLSTTSDGEVCKPCWSEIYKFHQYYTEIKAAHHALVQTQGSIKKEIFSTDSNQASECNEPRVKVESIWQDEIEKAINPIEPNGDQEDTIFCETLLDVVSFTQDFAGYICESNALDTADSDTGSDESFKISSATEKPHVGVTNKVIETTEATDTVVTNTTRSRRKMPVHFGEIEESCSKKASKKTDRRQNNTKIEDELVRKYIPMGCDICTFVGVDFTEMRNHFLAQHKHVQPYIICCGRKLNKRFKIVQHAYKHDDPEYFKCKECNKIFADNNILKTHWLANHAPEEKLIYACDKCPKRFSRQHFLELHKPSHIPVHERQYPCEKCPNGKPFASDHLLQIHINMRHKRATNVCHVCAKEIRDKQAFEKHVRLHFEDSGPRVKCPRPDCDRWLKDEDNLKQHMRRHNDEGNTFVCSECGKSCKNRRSLRSHLKYSHTDQVFTCDECQKTFKKAISLREHMAQHTGEPLYQCPFCSRTFNSNANMHAHKKRIHPVQWDHWRKTKRESAQKIITNKITTTVIPSE